MLAEARKDVNRYDTSCQHTEAGATASKNADAKWPPTVRDARLRCPSRNQSSIPSHW
jgi:hypothetical protein